MYPMEMGGAVPTQRSGQATDARGLTVSQLAKFHSGSNARYRIISILLSIALCLRSPPPPSSSLSYSSLSFFASARFDLLTEFMLSEGDSCNGKILIIPKPHFYSSANCIKHFYGATTMGINISPCMQLSEKSTPLAARACEFNLDNCRFPCHKHLKVTRLAI